MGETKVTRVGDKVYRVWVDLTNRKVAPTIMARAAQNNVVRPDLLILDGNVEVISASWLEGKETFEYTPEILQEIDQKQLKRILIRNGHPGKTTRTIQYLVKGSGKITVTYDSVKGGKVSAAVDLK